MASAGKLKVPLSLACIVSRRGRGSLLLLHRACLRPCKHGAANVCMLVCIHLHAFMPLQTCHLTLINLWRVQLRQMTAMLQAQEFLTVRRFGLLL